MKRRHTLSMVMALAVVLLHCFFMQDLQAEERTYYDISASDVRKIMIAVPNFSSSGGNQGASVAQLLTKGLELHSFVGVIDSSRYGGGKDADWKSLGADYVVMGQVGSDPAGIVVEGQILDVASNKQLAGRRFKGSAAQLEDMTLRLCDSLIVIDHGRKITEGSPRQLIAEHIEPQVVEVFEESHGQLENFVKNTRQLAERVETSGETAFFYCRDPAPLLARLADVDDLRYLLRASNLEDVFIKLTGRELRD